MSAAKWLAPWLLPCLLANTSLHASSVKEGDLLFVHVPLDTSQPLQNAIQAVGNATIDWLSNHGIPSSSRTTSFHVALATGQGTVVEAVTGQGVRVTPLDSFFHRFEMGSRFFLGNVQGMNKSDRESAVQFALKQLGKPYADDFRSPEKTPEAYYCSSLVDYAFRSAAQQDMFFTNEPFHLIFVPQGFWQAYYHEQNMTIPIGVGSNPTLLLHSSKVRYREISSALPLIATDGVEGEGQKNVTKLHVASAPTTLDTAGGSDDAPFNNALFRAAMLTGALLLFAFASHRLRSKRRRALLEAETVKVAAEFLEDFGPPPSLGDYSEMLTPRGQLAC